MSDTDLCFTPATVLAEQIAQKKLSPVELMRAVLERIETLDGKVNAFATVVPDLAMQGAKEAEQAVMRGDELGVLHGVPVSIKDLAFTKGIKTEKGSHTLKGFVPDVDAPLVSKLKQAGGVITGKTTTSEYAWTGVSRSPLTGITSNPWKLGYNAGASSAGAGAAAAAGFGPLHQGSDGAGSIRMPAHFSGVYGLKPTYGRIANWPFPNNDQTSHMGPMSRTVADSALMLKAMAGPHPLDHTSLETQPDDYPAKLQRDLKGAKIAYSPDLGHARVDPDVAELVRKAVGAFEEMGAHVEEVKDDFWRAGAEIIRFTWPIHELWLAKYLPEFESRMDPGLVACIRHGQGHSADAYLQARAKKLALIEQIHRFFMKWDFLLTPAVSVAAFPADKLMPDHWPSHDWDWISWAEFSYPFNYSGNPAASVPCGFTKDGLPVGLQIVAPRFDDLGVLQASHAFEQARPWADKRPDL